MFLTKGFLLAGFLGVLFFGLQNIDGRRCTRKRYTCPNTTLDYDSTNAVTVRTIKRQFIRDVVTSRFVPSNISAQAQEFLNKVYYHSDTDSNSLLEILFIFSLQVLGYLANAAESPNLCVAAENVNSSVSWATTHDGNITARALRGLVASVPINCNTVKYLSLNELGCEGLVEPPISTVRCHKRGYVYRVHENLELFGVSLPCCFNYGVLDLYVSNNYVDKAIAIAFSLAITPEYINLLASGNVNTILEPQYMLLNNNASVCCCHKREVRYTRLCANLNLSVSINIETAINQTYLYNECAP